MASHLDDNCICLQLEAGLDEDLQMISRDAKAHEEVLLHPWIAIIKDLDNHRIIQQKRVAEAIKEAMRANKKPFSSSFHFANISTNDQKTLSTLSSSFTWDYPPRLTDNECHLLMEHADCLKCQKFYTGHRVHQCSTTVFEKNYKTLTSSDAQCAKNNQKSWGSSIPQTNTIVSVTNADSTNQTDNFIAAVFPSLSLSIDAFNRSPSSAGHLLK